MSCGELRLPYGFVNALEACLLSVEGRYFKMHGGKKFPRKYAAKPHIWFDGPTLPIGIDVGRAHSSKPDREAFSLWRKRMQF